MPAVRQCAARPLKVGSGEPCSRLGMLRQGRNEARARREASAGRGAEASRQTGIKPSVQGNVQASRQARSPARTLARSEGRRTARRPGRGVVRRPRGGTLRWGAPPPERETSAHLRWSPEDSTWECGAPRLTASSRSPRSCSGLLRPPFGPRDAQALRGGRADGHHTLAVAGAQGSAGATWVGPPAPCGPTAGRTGTA
jgi:hypothetical protein